MRYKFTELYDLFPDKWVLTINSAWNNGAIETCEVYGVYNTQEELFDVIVSKKLNGCGIYKMVKEEDEVGFIFIITG